MKAIDRMNIEIEILQNQEDRGGLTDYGKGRLSGLKEALSICSSSLTLKWKHKKLFRTWKMYLEKTPNNTYLINEKEYLESELVTVYKEIMID